MKIYAELIGNYKNQRIKSLWVNKLRDDYGKMRVCAYFPIKIVEWSNGKISDDEAIDIGFEDDFMEQICYEGEVNNEDKGLYKLEIPVKPELNRVNILEKLDTIKKSLKKSVVVE